VLAGAAIAGAAVFVFRVSGEMPDFEVYWRAGVRAASAEPLYRAADGHYQFKYLPVFAVLVSPLGAIDIGTARAIWFGASVALLGVLLALSVRLLPARTTVTWTLVALTVVVLGKFYARELLLGQANLIFAAASVGALLALARGRPAAGGALVALSIVLKPYGALLLPWLAVRGPARATAAAGVGLAAAVLAPAVLYGIDGNVALHRDWWRTVTETTAPNLLNPDNVSWLAMYTRWIGEGPAASLLALATASGATGAAWMMWRRRREVPAPDGLEGALLLLLVPFVSPQGWDYVLLVATPAVMFVIDGRRALPRWLRGLAFAALAAIGLTIYDVMGRDAYLAYMAMSGITLCGIVVIAALVALRFRRAA
jgi:hypothetical protein